MEFFGIFLGSKDLFGIDGNCLRYMRFFGIYGFFMTSESGAFYRKEKLLSFGIYDIYLGFFGISFEIHGIFGIYEIFLGFIGQVYEIYPPLTPPIHRPVASILISGGGTTGQNGGCISPLAPPQSQMSMP